LKNKILAVFLSAAALVVILPKAFVWVAAVPNCDSTDTKVCIEKFSEKEPAKIASVAQTAGETAILILVFVNLGVALYPKSKKNNLDP
jgi:hypothetical protein